MSAVFSKARIVLISLVESLGGRPPLRPRAPVAWRNVNLIGNFDFTTSSTPVDIEALAARYQNEDFWRLSMQEGNEESPEQ
jgi:hypothetical protein